MAKLLRSLATTTARTMPCLSIQRARCSFLLPPTEVCVACSGSSLRDAHICTTQPGRPSEYEDPFDIASKVPIDFKYNRVPNASVVDLKNKREFPISFHHVHAVTPSPILQVIVRPRVCFIVSCFGMLTDTYSRHLSIGSDLVGIFA